MPAHRKKVWTYEQAAARKEKAEDFTRDVLEDVERADELEAMSVEEYAEERGVSEQGGSMKRKNGAAPASAATAEARENPLEKANRALEKQVELQERVHDLESEIEDRDERLDKIVDILEDDDDEFSPEERIEEIDKVISAGSESDSKKTKAAKTGEA